MLELLLEDGTSNSPTAVNQAEVTCLPWIHPALELNHLLQRCNPALQMFVHLYNVWAFHRSTSKNPSLENGQGKKSGNEKVALQEVKT
ncbi:hypothetical protein WJ883_11925, partial [Coxiella burnetii]